MSNESPHFLTLARHTPLVILTDLDGTLIPFAPTPEEARPSEALTTMLGRMARLPGVLFAIVSGRLRDSLEQMFPDPQIVLIAEHGGYRRAGGAWETTATVDASPIEKLSRDLDHVVVRFPGAWIERKTWGVALHMRKVDFRLKDSLAVESSMIVSRFLGEHPTFERIDGNMVIEVRPCQVRKSSAVSWVRERAGPGARVLALGDDLTDEHMFAALNPEDDSVLVRGGLARRTHARWEVESHEDVQNLLRFVEAVREGTEVPNITLPEPVIRTSGLLQEHGRSLLVVSNRLPDLRSPIAGDRRTKNVGGLVSALEPALTARGGVWLGWGGDTVADDVLPGLTIDAEQTPARAWIDYKQTWHRDYYNGFCNGTLWPLFHSFPSRVQIADPLWKAYVEVHDAFADAAFRLVDTRGTVWVHDYHLLMLAQAMRARGHQGPLGLFLHIPFPSLDILSILPWAASVLEAMLAYDLVGFHTPGHVSNFIACAAALLPVRVSDDVIELRGHRTRVAAFPIGILPEGFQEPADAAVAQEIEGLMQSLGGSRLVLGVDRLDYTKGIPERLLAFKQFLTLFPDWRGKVSLVQVSVPSRADVPEYVEQRQRVEEIVGRVNGEFGEANWVPIRYLYRSYGRSHLSQLYRAADVGYVTPLRDGMNLVAKEYVAAQDPDNPGVLLLSQFAGAAVEMREAILTNPWYAEGMARDLDKALTMPLAERKTRHAKLLETVVRTNALSWAEGFLDVLASCI